MVGGEGEPDPRPSEPSDNTAGWILFWVLLSLLGWVGVLGVVLYAV